MKLAEKILALMGDIGAIEKDGKNDFHNYAYLSHAGIMKKLQPKLVKHGVLIYPSDMEVIFHEGQKVVIKQEYTVTDGTESFKIYGIGEGTDKGDKASYKAQTGGHKYALKALLTLPDENDAEGDARTDKDAESKTSTPKAGKARAAKLQELEPFMGDMRGKVWSKYAISRWEDLDKTTADKMIAKYTEIAEKG